jgi:hypothetical protein
LAASLGPIIAQSGFNDTSGINSDDLTNSPYQLGALISGQGAAEPGWSEPWSSDGSASIVQTAVTFEGDGAALVVPTSGISRRWTATQTGIFTIDLNVRFNPDSRLIGYVFRDTNISDLQGPVWQAMPDGTFRVVDGNGNPTNPPIEVTGFTWTPDVWYKISLHVDVGDQTWEFFVDDQKYNAPDPLGFRGNPPWLDYLDGISFLSETSGASGVYIDNIQICEIPEPSALALLGMGTFGIAVFGRRLGRRNTAKASAILMGVLLLAICGMGEAEVFAAGIPIQWEFSDGGNGHTYELISPDGGINWTDAKVASEASSLGGYQGHLVTVNSQEEWDFIVTNFPHPYTWIGLTDQAQEGQFQWVTGEPFDFSAWGISPQEPNNAGNEDYVFYEQRSTGWGWNDFKDYATTYGIHNSYLVEYPTPANLLVSIDIRPGNDINPLNPDSNGNIPVAILGTDTFDVTTVDPATILLAEAGVKERGKNGDLMSFFRDVNKDGLTDLLVHIDAEGLVLDDDDIEAFLTGNTFDGTPISGSDAIRIVGPPSDNDTIPVPGDGGAQLTVMSVPEPATTALLCMGVFGLAVFGRRGKRRA